MARLTSARATSRVDGRAKVTGAAQICRRVQRAPASPMAASSTSTIAKGRIARIDASEALRVEGVLDVLTHENRPPMADTDEAYKDDVAPDRLAVPAALRRQDHVQRPADRAGASPRTGRSRASPPRWCAWNTTQKRTSPTCIARARRGRSHPIETIAPPKPRGDAEKALAAAAVRHEAEYYVPIEHHNPMELYASTVVWDGDGKLTVYDKTQGVQNVQRYRLQRVRHEAGRRARHLAVHGRRASARACGRSIRWCWRCWRRAR